MGKVLANIEEALLNVYRQFSQPSGGDFAGGLYLAYVSLYLIYVSLYLAYVSPYLLYVSPYLLHVSPYLTYVSLYLIYVGLGLCGQVNKPALPFDQAVSVLEHFGYYGF